MSLLDTYRQKLEMQIQEQKVRLDLLKARARHVTAQSKLELAEAEKHLDHARARFQELKGAGGSAMTDLKAGLSKALADLKDSTQRAAKHFNAQSPFAAPPAPKAKRAPAKKRPAVKTVRHKKR